MLGIMYGLAMWLSSRLFSRDKSIAIFGSMSIVVSERTDEEEIRLIQKRVGKFMSQAEQEEPTGISLQVDWYIPEGTQSHYANNVLVQAGQYEIIISFFETQLPILLGSPKENKRKLEELGSVRADVVSYDLGKIPTFV